MDIQSIIENAKKDPALFSTIDIENILESAENEKNEYLENKTMTDITKDIFDAIQSLDFEKDDLRAMCDKLIGYRFVDEVHELFKGKHIRWIRDGKLTNGGIVVDIKFMNDGIQVLCKNNMNRFIQYRFDECLTFQKLSSEEELLLMAYEHLQK